MSTTSKQWFSQAWSDFCHNNAEPLCMYKRHVLEYGQHTSTPDKYIKIVKTFSKYCAHDGSLIFADINHRSGQQVLAESFWRRVNNFAQEGSQGFENSSQFV